MSLVATGSIPASAASVRVVPVRVDLHYTASMGQHVPAVLIETPAHKEAYDLSLEPDISDGDVITVSLTLSYPGKDASDTANNLLYTCGDCFGLQPFDFAAMDRAAGPDKSAYGRRREIVLPKRKLDVLVDIEKVVVVPIPGDLPDRLVDLLVQVTVHNLPKA